MAGYVKNSRRNNFMDTELEKKIEQLERQRDNALRIRNPLAVRKYQRMIDGLAKESRNRSTDKTETKNNDY